MKLLFLGIFLLFNNLVKSQVDCEYKFLNCDSTNIKDILFLNQLSNGYLTRYHFDTITEGDRIWQSDSFKIFNKKFVIYVSKTMEGNFKNNKKDGLFKVFIPKSPPGDIIKSYAYFMEYKMDSIGDLYYVINEKTGEILHNFKRILNSTYWLWEERYIIPEQLFLRRCLYDWESNGAFGPYLSILSYW